MRSILGSLSLASLPLAASLLALPLMACAADEPIDEDWHPNAGGKADDTGNPLAYKTYDVLFTNPLCREYAYPTPTRTADGSATLTKKPKNVYCSSGDMAASAARESSPQNKLLAWLEPLDGNDEVFLAYLSFSNATVGDRLCELAEAGAKITFVLDAASTQSERLEACGATILLRGHAGSIGYAHNKLIIINPHSTAQYMKMVFSSGNMSSGVVTHHENWHFIDVKRKSYFAQNHLCLMDAQISEEASSGRNQYKAALDECRGEIEAEEESDIKAFFIPHLGDRKRAEKYLLGAIDDASSIDLGAHRFGHTKLINKLAGKLEAGDLTLRMVADDDMYWLDPVTGTGAEVGANQFFEAANIDKLETAGGDNFEIRYFETNHKEHLLHHNKYLVYRDEDGDAFGLIAGAPNLTGAGFNDNFENAYFIKIPAVLDAFDTQFARVWDGKKATPDEQDPPIATPRELMPAKDVAGI
ncbi:MAG: phospholipase D-like domain-containing protein [Kofleriaceae bacterium]